MQKMLITIGEWSDRDNYKDIIALLLLPKREKIKIKKS
jgi:hypothetical protein